MLVVGLVVSSQEERTLVEERLGRYTNGSNCGSSQSGEKYSLLTDWLNTQAEKFTWGQSIARELARADLKLKRGEYIAVMVIVSVGCWAWLPGSLAVGRCISAGHWCGHWFYSCPVCM